MADNPITLYHDPDFLQFNPEFTQLQALQQRQLSSIHVPGGSSDAARALWEWILADPEAKAWVDGQPDEWGMVMNPAYGVVVGSSPDSFPKADPYCYQPRQVTNVPTPYTPPQLCTIDWLPPATSFGNAAANTRRAFDGARIGEDTLNPPLVRVAVLEALATTGLQPACVPVGHRLRVRGAVRHPDGAAQSCRGQR